MNTPKKWIDITKNWESIPLEGYKFLFSQTKDRYDDVMSESISITEKATFLFKIITTFLISLVAANIKFNNSINDIVMPLCLVALIMVVFAYLMLPKKVIFKGSPPKELFRDYIDNKSYNDNDRVNIIYYHELLRYQQRIDIMTYSNYKRQFAYSIVLIMSIGFILFCIISLLSLFITRSFS